MGLILLFYKYCELSDLEELQAWQRQLCTSLNLKGRILLAVEGINGTVGGEEFAISAYIATMQAHPLFSDIDFKMSEGDASDFPSLYVSIKKEIVALGIDPKNLSYEKQGTALPPHEAHQMLVNKDENTVVLDCRNDYETRIGTFKDAIRPPVARFRDFPKYIDDNLHFFKNKKVIMGCTGGVRCVRGSAYLKQKGIEEVYHIEGGIHRYVEAYPDGEFRGKNYVFDERGALKVNDDVLTTCDHCATPFDNYTCCVNAECNKQIIICPACDERFLRTCSEKCRALVAEKKVNLRKKFRRPLPSTLAQ